MTATLALPCQSPLVRQRPWVSDGIWIGHESLAAVAPVAARLPHNGRWAIRGYGPEFLGGGVDLAAFIADTRAAATPAVVEFSTYDEIAPLLAEDREGEDRLLGVLDPTGRRWEFNQDFTGMALRGQRRWSWHIHANPDSGVAALLGVDHKDRPRFAVCSFASTDPT